MSLNDSHFDDFLLHCGVFGKLNVSNDLCTLYRITGTVKLWLRLNSFSVSMPIDGSDIESESS